LQSDIGDMILFNTIQCQRLQIEWLSNRTAQRLIPVERDGEESGLRFQGSNRVENRDQKNPEQ
jgi:hypothetical protein